MKKQTVTIGLTVLGIAAIIATAGFAMGGKSNNNNAQEQTVTVENRDLKQTLKTDGVVALTSEQHVFATSSGLIQQRLVAKGDVVTAGQVLFILDTKDLNEKLAQAKYQLSVDMDALADAKASGDVTAKASYDQAKASYERAKSDYQDNQALYQSGAISKSELEQAQSKMESANVSLKSAEDQWRKGNVQTETQKLSEKVKLDQLSIENIVSSIAGSTIKAPVSGTVTAALDESQAFLNSGTLVATIADLKGLEVTSMISEYDIGKLKLGQSVAVTTLGDTTKVYEGKVSKIDSTGTVQNDAVLVAVTIDLLNPDEAIKPNFTVSIDVSLGTKEGALTVPYETLMKDADGSYYVTRIDPNTKAETKVLVQKGFETDLYVEVLGSDLKAGDEILVPADKATAKQKTLRGGPGGGAQNL